MMHAVYRLAVAAVATIAVAAALFAEPALAQNIAVVNGKPIPKAKADEIIAILVKQGQKDSPELQTAVRDELVSRELVLQEADKRGLQSTPEVQAELDRARQSILIAAVAQDYIKNNPPSDADLRARYDQIVKTMPKQEYHAHHILVDNEAAAKDIIKKLKAGASFDELAKQSKDQGSAASGGDLGWAPPTQYVKPFADALIKLQKGKITDTPVKSDYGWHVIRLDDIRDAKVPSFDEAKPQIAQLLMQDKAWQQGKVKALVESLRAKAKIE